VAGTPGVAAARTFGMAIGTGIATVVVTLFFNRLTGIDNAQARVTGAFHLGNRGHSRLLQG
jgi:uncharacterized membrane protein YgaE (UPF0421/DUF939 family)